MILVACIVAYLVVGAVAAGVLRRLDVLSALDRETGVPVVVAVLWPAVAGGYVVIAVVMLVTLPLRALYRWVGGAS